MKLRFYLLFIHVFMNQLILAQNLVPNGDFENYSALPNYYGQTYRCNGWSNVNGGINPLMNASPDYFHHLGYGIAQLPNCIYGTVSAYSGEGIMGFITCGDPHPNYREYISTHLSSPTVIGNTYTVSFWLTNGTAQLYGKSSNRIGLRFSSSPLSQVSDEPIGGIPQLEIPNEVWTTTWQQFSFTFTADSSYNFITLGNFYDGASTSTTTHVNTAINYAYYFIDKIEIIPENLTIISDNSFCLGDSSLFNFSCFSHVVDSVLWNFDDPFSGNANTSTDSSTIHVFTTPGTYNVRLISYFGNNADTVVKPISIASTSPTIPLVNDTTLCSGAVLTLDVTIPYTTCLWNDNSTNPIFYISELGNYWVEVTNVCGTSSDTIQVSDALPPSIFLGNDTTLCQGKTLTLDVTIPNTTCLWNDNSTNPIFNVFQEGTYLVEVTNSCGTHSYDEIYVNYTSAPSIFLGNDTTLCQGGIVTLDVTIPNTTCLWNDNSTNPIFNISQPGNYWVEVSDGYCSSSDSLNVSFSQLSTINLGNDTALCLGDTLTLDATVSNANYAWQNGSTAPTLELTQQGIYWVEVTVNNCSATDTITINSKDCDPPALELPNVITANGDGVNGLFVPTVSKGIASMKTTIYNRWGNIVFETNKLSIEWDGQECSDGTYFWIVYYTDENGKEDKLEGVVTLIR